MNYPEQIVTVDNFSDFSIKEKGSTFIGQVYHCETGKEVNETISIGKEKILRCHTSLLCISIPGSKIQIF